MKAKRVSATRSKRGLHRENSTEPQVMGLTPQTTLIPRVATMKTYLLRMPQTVQPQPAPASRAPALFIGFGCDTQSTFRSCQLIPVRCADTG